MDSATHPSQKRKHGPFQQSKGQQFSTIKVGTNFGGSDFDGKHQFSKVKSHYQPIQKGAHERNSYAEETKQGYRGKNQRHLEFDQHKPDAEQNSPDSTFFKGHLSNEKTGPKKGSGSQHDPLAKGSKSSRGQKNQRKISHEHPYLVNSEDDYFDMNAGRL